MFEVMKYEIMSFAASSYDNNSKPLRLYRIPVAHLSGTSAISEHGRRPPSAGNRRYKLIVVCF